MTAEEMREVDHIAVEDVGLQLLQMMENAGRALAWHVREVRAGDVVVVAGNGGNGGGGLACARHLANRGIAVHVVLDRPPGELTGAVARQYTILKEMGISMTESIKEFSTIDDGTTVVDALIGYGLSGDVRAPAASYIDHMNDLAGPTVSLDVPSGVNATTGETLGTSVASDRIVTLALPKRGLDVLTTTLYLADISIPRTVYKRLDIEYDPPFEDNDWVRLLQ